MKTRRKNNKRNLTLSLLAMLLCAAMLVGSTMAWFTDNASTSVNKIEAGTLKIDLHDDAGNSLKDQTLKFVKADDKTQTIDPETIKWEPGAKFLLQPVTVVNEGNLYAKCLVTLSAVNGNTEANGVNLADVIDVIINGVTLGTLSDMMAKGTAMGNEFVLAPAGDAEKKDEASYGEIALMMQTTAGNDYQGLSLNSVAITVVAGQATVEYDSYGNQYDANASYPVVNQNAFDDAVKNAQPGDVIQVSAPSIDLSNDIPAGVSIAGNGADKTTANVPATPTNIADTQQTTGLVIDKAGVTISGVTLAKNEAISSNEYAGVVAVKTGGTTFNDVSITSTGRAAAVVVNSFDEGVVTISNSTLSSSWKTLHIVDGANGKIVIDNTTITGVYTFNVNSNSSQNLEIVVNNSTLNGWTSYSGVKSVTFNGVTFGKGGGQQYLRPASPTTFTNCEFNAGFMMGYSGDGVNNTYTLTNCTYNGQPLTAQNIIGTLISTADIPDYEYMKSNLTLIVDGVTVVYQ